MVELIFDLPVDTQDDGVVEVLADERRIAQKLGDRLTNALLHSPPEGRMAMTVATIEEMVRMTVADTGIGIPPEDIPHIFERF